MIGIILWAIVIIFIVVCAYPGFMTALIVNTAIVLSVYGLIAWIVMKIKKRRRKISYNENSPIDTIREYERML